jgi:hypothetical protein
VKFHILKTLNFKNTLDDICYGPHPRLMTKVKGRKENVVQVSVSGFTFIFTSVRKCKEGESQSLIRRDHFGS